MSVVLLCSVTPSSWGYWPHQHCQDIVVEPHHFPFPASINPFVLLLLQSLYILIHSSVLFLCPLPALSLYPFSFTCFSPFTSVPLVFSFPFSFPVHSSVLPLPLVVSSVLLPPPSLSLPPAPPGLHDCGIKLWNLFIYLKSSKMNGGLMIQEVLSPFLFMKEGQSLPFLLPPSSFLSCSSLKVTSPSFSFPSSSFSFASQFSLSSLCSFVISLYLSPSIIF